MIADIAAAAVVEGILLVEGGRHLAVSAGWGRVEGLFSGC